MTRRVAANRASTSRRLRKSRAAHMRGNRASIRSNRTSMPALAFLHRRELLGTGRPLICRLPGLVGHAVDGLAALVLGHRSAFGVRLVLEPVRQAVAAEAREVHQIDVLDIGAAAQMFDEAPEHRGFKFRSGFVVDCHDCYLRSCAQDIDLKWEMSQSLPYRSVNRGLTGAISATPMPENAPWSLTAPAGLREIFNELI